MGMKSSKRLQAPSDPAEIMRRRMERLNQEARQREREHLAASDPRNWGPRQDINALPANDDIIATLDVSGKITRAKRYDVFALMRTAGTLTGDHIIAIDKFQRDIAIRHQTAGASGQSEPVDGKTPKDYPGARIEAAQRLEALCSHMGPDHSRLLLEISTPTITRGERVNWRSIVLAVTGIYDKNKQGKVVSKACDSLVAAYEAGAHLTKEQREKQRIAA